MTMGITRVPRCGKTSTSPTVASLASADETGKRDTPMRSHTASLSIIMPGSIARLTMAARSASSTASVRLPRSEPCKRGNAR